MATFLDVALRVGYLRKPRVNAVQLLPIREFPYDKSLGYNNPDFSSPETACQIDDGEEVARYVPLIGALFAPEPGPWREVFNSDAVQSGVGHVPTGNDGAVLAGGPPRHGMEASTGPW